MNDKIFFEVNMPVVSKMHGLGIIINTSEVNIDDVGTDQIQCYEIFFKNENITLTVPIPKMIQVGMRNLVGPNVIPQVMKIFKSEPANNRVIWSKRFKEYEQKLYSGDIFAMSEAIRDLYQNAFNPSRSNSERKTFDTLMHRVAEEISVIQSRDFDEVFNEIMKILSVYQQNCYQPSETTSSSNSEDAA